MLATTPPKNGRFDPTRSEHTIANASSIKPTSVSPPIQPFTRVKASMSDSPLILSALFLLDVALAGKGPTRLGVDIIEELAARPVQRTPKYKAPPVGRGFAIR